MGYVDLTGLSAISPFMLRSSFLKPRPVVTIPSPMTTTVKRPPLVRQTTLIKPAVITEKKVAALKVVKRPLIHFGRWGKRGFVGGRWGKRGFVGGRWGHAPSGSTYQATDVKVVPGADPVSKLITGAGAPMTGQTVSLKEKDSIIPIAPTAVGMAIVDKPTPVGTPIISFKPIQLEMRPGEPATGPGPVAKAGLSPIVYLILAGIALPLLFGKKGKRR